MDYFFYDETPAIFNLSQFKEEVKSAYPAIKVDFYEAFKFTSWQFSGKRQKPDYIKDEFKPKDSKDSWGHPDIIVFRDVPEGVTEDDLRALILAHSATESEKDMAERNFADDLITKIVSYASPETLSKLKLALSDIKVLK